MSRRSKGAVSVSNILKENDPSHREFLKRSLARNDKEFAAVVELNRKLTALRKAIQKSLGEECLLDIGTGRIHLESTTEELLGTDASMSDPDKETVTHFLLCSTLRQRLLNRLARRLNRVAHWMDGEDASPPQLPRYGDLRLYLDDRDVAIQNQIYAAKRDATKRITSADEESTMQDYALLREDDAAYERLVDPESGTLIRYTILDQPYEPDHQRMGTTGVGAASSFMYATEKEAEHKRWQTALLSKIPENPTFDEIGTENRVFLLEERRKRARGEQVDLVPLTPKKVKSDGDVDQDDAVEDTDKPPGSAKKKGIDEDEEVEDNTENVVKLIKPMSLAAVPSFHNQDLLRIMRIQGTQVMDSLQSRATIRYETATNDYNRALQISNDLFDKRQQAHLAYNQFCHENRSALSSPKEVFMAQVQQARQHWNQRRKEFEHRKLDRHLPTRWNRIPEGTTTTKAYGSRPDAVSGVATCVADIVDAVDMTIRTGQQLEQFDPFVPPPMQNLPPEPDPATLQRNKEMEHKFRRDAQQLSEKLRTCEEDRLRCWRKFLKVRAELLDPRGVNDALTRLPLPGLRQQGTTYMSSQLAGVGNRTSAPAVLPATSFVPGTSYRPAPPPATKMLKPATAASGAKEAPKKAPFAPVSYDL